MKTMKIIISLFILLTFLNANAQDSSKKDNIKDYPLVTRFDSAKAVFYKATKWDSYKLPVYQNKPKEINYDNPLVLEGKIMRWQYTTSPDNNPAFVLKNYEKAFKNSGYKILLNAQPGVDFDEGPASFDGDYYGSHENLNLGKFGFKFSPIGNHKAIIIANTKQDGKNIYIVVVISDFSDATIITQDVIEVEEAETGLVTAKNISDDISAHGHIAIYDIHFDVGKSELKAESAAALKNIADYLNAHADQRFLIVGHTDNTGDFEANIKLSQERAQAVIAELVSKYQVKAEQLKAYGDGSTAPLSTNSTEAGKAKNRRVEIVAM